MLRKIYVSLGIVIVVVIIAIGTASRILWPRKNLLEVIEVPQLDLEEAERSFDASNAARIEQPYPMISWVKSVNELSVANGIAYFATAESGIQIVDVSDPANLRGLRTIDTPQYVNYLEWHDGIIYATAGCTHGVLYSIDVKNPVEPILLDIEGLTCGGQFQIVGERLYHANHYSGLLILNISNPSKLHQISEISFNIPYTRPQSSHPSDTHMQLARSIALYNQFAFLSTIGDQGDKQFIVDISDPTKPSVQSENYEMATYGWSQYYPFGEYLYALMDTGIMIRKFSEIGDKPPLGFYESNAQRQGLSLRQRDLYLVGERAYLLSGDKGMEILDVSDPAHVRQVGLYTQNLKEPSAVWVENDIAYVTDRATGLHLIDVKNPKDPKLLSAIQ